MHSHYPEVEKVKIQFKIFQLDHEIFVRCQSHSVESALLSQVDNLKVECIDIEYNSTPIKLSITGKAPGDTKVDDQGSIVFDAHVEIEKIWINNILLKNWAISKFYKFYPTYSEAQRKYATDNNVLLKECITEEFGFHYNGCLIIDLDDFFMQYHNILESKLVNTVSWVRGRVADDSIVAELESILKNL